MEWYDFPGLAVAGVLQFTEIVKKGMTMTNPQMPGQQYPPAVQPNYVPPSAPPPAGQGQFPQPGFVPGNQPPVQSQQPFVQPQPGGYQVAQSNSSVAFIQNMGATTVNVSGYTFNVLSIIAYVGGLLSLVAVFLPFASISINLGLYPSGESASLIQVGDGWFVLLLVVAACVLSSIPGQGTRRRGLDIASVAVSALSLVVVIFDMTRIQSAAGSLAGYIASSSVSLAIGAWLALLGTLALTAGTVAVLVNNLLKAKGAAPQAPFVAGPQQPVGQQWGAPVAGAVPANPGQQTYGGQSL